MTHANFLALATVPVLLLCSSLAPIRSVPASEHLYAGKEPLTTDEVKAALVGNSVKGKSSDRGFPFTSYYPTYGVMKGSAGYGGVYKEEGIWSVTHDIYCVTWENWQEKLERCLRVYRFDDDTIFWVTPNGILEGKDKLVSGNPAGL